MVGFLQSPVAIQLSTATPELRPTSTRGFGCKIEEDLQTLRLSVLQSQAERFLKALETGDRVAINFGHVVDFRSVQVKGSRLEVRAADAAEKLAAKTYLDELRKMMTRVGVSEDASRGIFHSGSVVIVRVRADELYDQTPGPGAGAKLETTWQRL